MKLSDDLTCIEVGGRRFPIALIRVHDDYVPPMVVNGRLIEPMHNPWRQVTLKFESRFILSIAWGFGMHGDNYNYPFCWTNEDHRAMREDFIEEPREVEIAVRHQDYDFLGTWPDGDQIQGYVDDERLLEIIEGCNTGTVPVWFDVEGDRRAKEGMKRMTRNMREGREPWEDGPADQQETTNNQESHDQGEA